MTDQALKLGKLPAVDGAYKFKLDEFLGSAVLPTAPDSYGHENLVQTFGMLGNDQVGDCVEAGAAHETMLWLIAAGVSSSFTTANVISDYSAITGYDPSNPNTDDGTNMATAAKYRRKTGIIDASGNRHKIDAYLELAGVSATSGNKPTLLDQIASASYVFGSVGIGLQFPQSAMDEFKANKIWQINSTSPIIGGHYVPVIGRNDAGNFLVVTWGKVQEVAPSFLLKYVDEAIVYVSLESLKNGKTLDGFDIAGLQSALSALGGGTIPVPTPAPTPTPEPTPAPEPAPVVDPNVAILDAWFSNSTSAQAAWQEIKDTHNL